MNRTITRGALFAAPLIIAGSLASSAMADQQVIALQQDGGCVVSATSTAYVGLQNKNAFEIDVQYSNSANNATGTLQVAANSDYLYAIPYDTSNLNNTITYVANGWTSPVSSNANVSNECSASDLTNVAPVATSPVTTAPTTGGDTTSTDTGVVGGKGGDEAAATAAAPATTNTAATLADTGASQILPYSAAALIAVATLGMTVAVRKNLI